MKLAAVLQSGDGVRTIFSRPLPIISGAANKGNIEAAYNLGMMYQAGIGVDSSLEKRRQNGMRWPRCEGHLQSQVNLGIVYDYWPGNLAGF